MMVQPKAPPLSIRPGDERMALIDAHAQKRGITRHAAVLELIDVGLHGAVSAATARPAPRAKAETVPAPRLSVSLPYAGDLDRKPTQKGGKK